MRTILERGSFGSRGRRVPKRNSTLLRLEELETRTVLSPSAVALALPTAVGLGGGLPTSLLRLIASATTGEGHASGLADAPGIAKHLVSQPGGTDSSPGTPTVPGSNPLSNPSDQPGPTQTTITGQVSSQTTSLATDLLSTSAVQNAVAAFPFLLPSSETTQANTTNSNNTTGNNSVPQGSAAPQSLLVLVLNRPLLVAGAEQSAETVGIITAAQSNPEGAVVSAQTLASARASTNPQLRILLGDVPLSDTDVEAGRKEDGGGLDKPMIPEKVPQKPEKQENNELKQSQPDDKEAAPVVPLEESVFSDEAVDTAASDACFAIWEAEMAPADHEAQPPVPTSGEETPNWSVAALGLALGGVWGMSPARPRDDRKRDPAWPARPTLPL